MADEITDAEIAELRRLCEAATPGPWTRKWSGVVGAGDDSICTNGRGGNNHEWIDKGNLCMDLIAAMHSALPGLLARLERAEKAARIWYDGDGNPVELESAEAVTAGRIGAAKELARLLAIEAGGCAGCDSRDARIATLERELSRWRGCEQVEGDYVCKHEFECSQILRPRIATLEAQRDEYAEQYGVMGVALTVAERKLSAYVGVCAGDKELTESVLPKVRAALRGVEGK